MQGELKNPANIAAICVLATLAIGVMATSTFARADALLIKPEEHWKYNVQWNWKPELRKTVGTIYSQIIVTNETAASIHGYIADSNGTRLEVYDEMQKVMVKYVYDNDLGSKWEIAGETHEGYFTINIPERYRDAETIAIYIGGNSYYVDLSPYSYDQPYVKINSARMDYRTNPALDSIQTNISSNLDTTSTCQYSSSSLIDRILMQFSLIPCLKA